MLLKDKLALLPLEPGCYLMKDKSDQVIYVGKAKNLKNRVKSYFTGAHNQKTTKLVSEIVDFSYVMTRTEQESLVLEMNLIKQYSPKYNIRLMDDKTYPYIELTTEQYPKLQIVRRKKPKGRLFGPYPNAYAARETVRLLNRIYPFRKCDHIPKKACLYFHIGQCLAPCINEDVNYDQHIENVIKFLKGDTKEVLNYLKNEMQKASDFMQFEKAAEYRDMMMHIEQTTEKQLINLNDFKDRDIVGFAKTNEDVAIQILMIRQGKMIDQHQIVFSYVGEYMEAIYNYLIQYYEGHQIDEILLSPEFNIEEATFYFGTKAIIPKIGDKKKMVDLAEKNAKYDLEHYYMLYRHKDEKKREALDALSDVIKKEVKKIEVFDNAQLFGTAPISAMIVFENMDFNKKSYRKYHLKTTTNDDYQAMKEVTYRRYQKLLIDQQPMPDLILIDGGKGQVNAALEMIDALNINVLVAGLKKNSRHQLEALVFNQEVIPLLKHSELYKFLLELSEEVHRFAITFHRSVRQKQANKSYLDDIKGIGPKRKQLLLQNYKSIEEIKKASFAELRKLNLPEEAIKQLKEAIHEKDN
ncbi:excinuclease ABC subunit UvrC [Mycoplasmatota bacterium]|nr:excinuclease ABC subunit UvrC [Mycoplasmatota bacterium]